MGENQKITVCAKYAYEGYKTRCLKGDCFDMPDRKTGEVCSEPRNTFEEAQVSINAKLLQLSKTLKAFQEGRKPSTIKFCDTLAWMRHLRMVDDGKAVEPMYDRQKREICTDDSQWESVQRSWEQEATRFVRSHYQYIFKDPRFQKVAEDARKTFDQAKSTEWARPGMKI